MRAAVAAEHKPRQMNSSHSKRSTSAFAAGGINDRSRAMTKTGISSCWHQHHPYNVQLAAAAILQQSTVLVHTTRAAISTRALSSPQHKCNS